MERRELPAERIGGEGKIGDEVGDGAGRADTPDIVALMLHDQQKHASGGRQQQIGQHGLVVQSHRQTRLEQIHRHPAVLDVAIERPASIVGVVMEMAWRRQGGRGEGILVGRPV